MYYLTVPEIRSLKSRCWQSCVPSGGSRGESSFQKLPAFLGFWPLLLSQSQQQIIESFSHQDSLSLILLRPSSTLTGLLRWHWDHVKNLGSPSLKVSWLATLIPPCHATKTICISEVSGWSSGPLCRGCYYYAYHRLCETKHTMWLVSLTRHGGQVDTVNTTNITLNWIL